MTENSKLRWFRYVYKRMKYILQNYSRPGQKEDLDGILQKYEKMEF